MTLKELRIISSCSETVSLITFRSPPHFGQTVSVGGCAGFHVTGLPAVSDDGSGVQAGPVGRPPPGLCLLNRTDSGLIVLQTAFCRCKTVFQLSQPLLCLADFIFQFIAAFLRTLPEQHPPQLIKLCLQPFDFLFVVGNLSGVLAQPGLLLFMVTFSCSTATCC